MLIDFTVENFRSIKEAVTLSAVAQKSKVVPSGDESTRRVKPNDEIALPFAIEGWNFELLPVLALFGANASGKSNVLNALDSLLTYMSVGATPQWEQNTRFMPFLLREECREAATRFELRVALNGTVYTYTLHLKYGRIALERLEYAVAATKINRLLYARTYSEEGEQYVWGNGRAFHGPHRQLEGSVNKKEPFFSLLIRLNIPVVNPLTQWVHSRSEGVGLGSEQIDEQRAAKAAYGNIERENALSKLIQGFDTGVSKLIVRKGEAENNEDQSFYILACHDIPNYELAGHELTSYEIRLPFTLESRGTQRLVGLCGRILDTMENRSLLLVDELDASIHPNIVREIVQIFQNPKTNPQRAQMIFTSHDAALQRGQLLRRDQIWFTQKRGDGSTELYPLSDFKPRNDTAIDKSYLDGRYGAVPLLPDEDELAAITTGKRHAA